MRSRRSNPLALAVLSCLHERPMHPYEIDQVLRHRSKHDSIRLNYGSLYAVVDSLEKRGLVQVSHTDQEGQRPRRTVYAITETGLAELHDWLAELIESPAKEYPQFQAGLSLIGGLPPDEVLELLRRRVVALESRLAELTAPQPEPTLRLFLIEQEYEASQCAAELAFVRDLIEDIASERLEGVDLWRQAWASGRLDTSAHPRARRPLPYEGTSKE